MAKQKYQERLFKKAAGVRLDLGCGIHKQKGFVGLDIVKHPCVDIVQDLTKYPWRVPNNSCIQIIASHLWEHIEPKHRFKFMDEIWRICRHDGQLILSAPHAGSFLESAHPAHYMCPNKATFEFFDPEYFLWHSCSYKKPKPWKILRNDPNISGCIEVVMEPRKTEKGRPILLDKWTEKGCVEIEGMNT